MNRRKALTVIILTVLLLTFTVSGTVAWIIDKTDPVTNVFKPATVKTEIVEVFDNNKTKSSIKIKNSADEGSGIPVYVRVALAGSWRDDDGNVIEPWTPNFTVGSDWLKGSDGYYYYTKALGVDQTTSDLLDTSISGTDTSKPGLHLVVDVIHQSIQAEPASAVTEAWGVTVAADGTISKSN